MAVLEDRVKQFAVERGASIVGVAGPGRLDGPPSLEPAYIMEGARSILSLAIPMDVPAIYRFLSKESQTDHNLDQLLGNQRIHRIARDVAGFLRSNGSRACEVPPNNTYRRSLDPFATLPSFSHRLGAVASGIAGMGWSGNVVTRQHGAAVYLATVVTDAELESDPALPARYFADGMCAGCKLCARTCVAAMFEEDEEEYVLLNGELLPRGRRRGLDLCNASCFGLHALSRDKRWSTWGKYWIEDWVGRRPVEGRLRLRRELLKMGRRTPDTAPRYDAIRLSGSTLFPEDTLEEIPLPGTTEGRESETKRLVREKVFEPLGVVGIDRLRDTDILTCGHCSLVCGPEFEETHARYRALVEGGIVVPGPGPDEMIKAGDYAEAVGLRAKYPLRARFLERQVDGLQSGAIWGGRYLGLEPGPMWRGMKYKRRLRKAEKAYRLASPCCIGACIGA